MGLCSPSSGTYVIIFLGASKKKVLRKTAVNPPKPEFFSKFDPETSKQLDSSLNLVQSVQDRYEHLSYKFCKIWTTQFPFFWDTRFRSKGENGGKSQTPEW